jgi:hypothetical protein
LKYFSTRKKAKKSGNKFASSNEGENCALPPLKSRICVPWLTGLLITNCNPCLELSLLSKCIAVVVVNIGALVVVDVVVDVVVVVVVVGNVVGIVVSVIVVGTIFRAVAVISVDRAVLVVRAVVVVIVV